jgi:hypothetical protein
MQSATPDFARVLTTLARVGPELFVHCKSSKLVLSTVNASRSAFVVFTFAPAFFDVFRVTPRAATAQGGGNAGGGGGPGSTSEVGWTCKMNLKVRRREVKLPKAVNPNLINWRLHPAHYQHLSVKGQRRLCGTLQTQVHDRRHGTRSFRNPSRMQSW